MKKLKDLFFNYNGSIKGWKFFCSIVFAKLILTGLIVGIEYLFINLIDQYLCFKFGIIVRTICLIILDFTYAYIAFALIQKRLTNMKIKGMENVIPLSISFMFFNIIEAERENINPVLGLCLFPFILWSMWAYWDLVSCKSNYKDYTGKNPLLKNPLKFICIIEIIPIFYICFSNYRYYYELLNKTKTEIVNRYNKSCLDFNIDGVSDYCPCISNYILENWDIENYAFQYKKLESDMRKLGDKATKYCSVFIIKPALKKQIQQECNDMLTSSNEYLNNDYCSCFSDYIINNVNIQNYINSETGKFNDALFRNDNIVTNVMDIASFQCLSKIKN